MIAVLGGLSLACGGLPLYFMLLPVSGFLVGFLVGTAAIASLFGGGIFATTLGIAIGLLFGVIFAIASYLFWYVGVLLTAALAGVALGSSFFGAIGIHPDWLLFILAFGLGAAFLFVALVLNFPVYLVIVSTALAGSAIAIGGVLVLLGQVDPSSIGAGDTWRAIGDNIILWILWAAGAGVGIAAQVSMMSRVAVPDDRWASIVSKRG